MTEGAKKTDLQNVDHVIAVPQAGTPMQQVQYARECADTLINEVIAKKKKKVIIRGEQYLEFEDWQTIARFYGATVGVEWTKPIVHGEKFGGYEARAVVYDSEGITRSAAEASCTISEPKWANSPRFQLRSMAQTRACAKALRNVFGYVVVMAGLKATPSEELDDQPKEQVSQPDTGSQKDKVRIYQALTKLGVDANNPDQCKTWVKANTGLELTEAGFAEIAGRLETLIEQKNEADAKSTT